MKILKHHSMKSKSLPCLVVITFSLLACEKQTFKVETHPAEVITSTTVKLVGKITNPFKTIEEYGFYWWAEGNEANPASTFIQDEKRGYPNSFETWVSGLEPEKNYFYKAYATDGHETAFGEIVEFTTLEARK
jgi:hypothetical protein